MNLYKKNNPGGAPAKYDSPEEMSEQIGAYFDYIKKEDKPPTITGLTLFLGFGSRQSFYDYKKKINFREILSRAHTVIECYHEEKLASGKGNLNGNQFILNNMGWKDQKTLEINDQRIEYDGENPEAFVRSALGMPAG